MSTTTGYRGGRPMIMATRGVVTSGHYLATQIGIEILCRGGNAFDAAAAVGIALTVCKPHQNGIGGEMPTLLYVAEQKKVWALSGHGVAPAAATLDHFKSLGISAIPGDGLLPALVPPAIASWILLLRTFGTMRIGEVLAPSVRLAEEGVPMYDALHGAIAQMAPRFRGEWPTSAAVFLDAELQSPAIGSAWRQPDWARTFRALIDEDARHRDRETGLLAVHDLFYRGPIAREIVAFCQGQSFLDATGQAHHGLLTLEDFAAFEARLEEPATTVYRGVEVHKCGPWTQGPVLLQSLNLLEGFDLAAMGHNSADYIHTVVECMKLAYADREFYYGDPLFVPVPLERLLDKNYAAARRNQVDPRSASLLLRPGDTPTIEVHNAADVEAALARAHGDTTKLDIIDRAGNMVSVTTSGGWLMSSPVVPGLGFPLGTRGQMFALASAHPNCLAPGKRPRTTLTPSLATRAGRPYLSFGSPGGDSQDQWALQLLLNVLDFDMSLQEAVEAPTFSSHHWPDSFYPRKAMPNSLQVEDRVPAETRAELIARGHRLIVAGPWSGGNGLAAGIDPATSVRHAAASPRLEPAHAAGY